MGDCKDCRKQGHIYCKRHKHLDTRSVQLKEEAYKKYLEKKYGLLWDEYLELLDKQSGCCAICGLEAVLVVDHDHNTNKIRGLLCVNCNSALGKLGDTLEGLLRAVEYLREKT